MWENACTYTNYCLYKYSAVSTRKKFDFGISTVQNKMASLQPVSRISLDDRYIKDLRILSYLKNKLRDGK